MRNGARFIPLSVAFGLLAACGGEVDGSKEGEPPSTLCGVSTECGSSSPTPAPSTSAASGRKPPPNQPSQDESFRSCDPGHTQVTTRDACEEGDACYERRQSNGTVIVCTGAKGLCDEPACPAYSAAAESCPSNASCFEHQFCDTILLCEEQDAECDGYSDCDEDDERVETAEACALEKDRCYSRFMCGTRTFCLRAEADPNEP